MLNNELIDNFYDISDSTKKTVKENVYNSLIPIAKQQDSTITTMITDLVSSVLDFLPEISSKLRKICENIMSDNSDASRIFILDLFVGCCSQDAKNIYKTIGDIFCDIAIDEIRNGTNPATLKSICSTISLCIGLDKKDSGIFFKILEAILFRVTRLESVSIFCSILGFFYNFNLVDT